MNNRKRNWGGAFLVASGILLSRISGLIRIRALAHFLGDSEAGDAFYAAIKIPNFPQNLLGEGVLSASFIPVYANLVAKKESLEAGKVAGAILGLLSTAVTAIVVLGITLTPHFIDLVAPGFSGSKRELTISLVQIIFPGTGILVISAWCLGILNSHHKFFLSYAAPVIANLTIILFLYLLRSRTLEQLAVIAAWGLVAGSILQLLVQIPTTLALVPQLKISLSTKLSTVRTVIHNFIPVVISRGVIQLSAYIDSIIASFLPNGAVATLGYAQSIYMLPISLFGMSVSAAELPAMSADFDTIDFQAKLQTRINSSCRKIAYFVVPCIVGMFLLGDVVAAFLFQTGKFDSQTSLAVWWALGGSAVGLLASTLGRLYSSAFYSLRDTRTPLRFSLIRVTLTAALGYGMGLKIPEIYQLGRNWSTALLTASAGISGWLEFFLLRRAMNSRIGNSGIPLSYLSKLWLAALLCGGMCLGLKYSLTTSSVLSRGVLLVGGFALCYFPLTYVLGVPEAAQAIDRIKNRRI